MPVSTTVGHMLNNLVIMLCSVCSSVIYQKQQVHTVQLFIEQPLYISLFCAVDAYSSQFHCVRGTGIMAYLRYLCNHIVV
jgi:hypothetical protein